MIKNFISTAIILITSLFIIHVQMNTLYGQSSPEKLEMPEVKSFKLENGIRIFHIKDELPLVTIVVSIGYGRLYETKSNAGMSSLLARTISLAGSKKYPGPILHEKIDSMGGKISVFSSWESTVVLIKVLKRFKNEAFDIITDIVHDPNFDMNYLETAKSLISDEIKRKYDDPADIAFQKTRELIFNGDGYGSVMTEKKIRSYTMDMIREAWGKYYQAGNMMVGISTSIPYHTIKLMAAENFSVFKSGREMNYVVDQINIMKKIKKNNGQIFFYPKDIPQSTIVVGTIAPPLKNKGYYALKILNYILGGGSFNSRLMREIRVKRGLAYAVQSIIRMRHRGGVFLAYAMTNNKSAGDVLSIILDNIKDLSKKSPLASEISWAKNSISNSYIFKFDTPMNLLMNYFDIEYYKLPQDFHSNYIKRLNMVNDDDLLNESRRLFKNGLIKVVVGKKSLAEKLKDYGNIVFLDK